MTPKELKRIIFQAAVFHTLVVCIAVAAAVLAIIGASRANHALKRAVSAQQLARAQQLQRRAASIDACHVLQRVITQAYKPVPGGRVVLPAVLGTRHSTITLYGRHGKRRFSFTAATTKVRLTIIEPKTKTSQAAQQIQADGLTNCKQHALGETRNAPGRTRRK